MGKHIVFGGILSGEFQRVNRIVTVLRQHLAQARRQMRVHEKFHVSGKWILFAVNILCANSWQAKDILSLQVGKLRQQALDRVSSDQILENRLTG
jgi:hypothetical protein